MKKFIITLLLFVCIILGNTAQAAADSTHHKGHHYRGHDGHGKRGHHRGIRLFHRHHHHEKDNSRSGGHSHQGRGGHGDKETIDNK